jgi:hypothetical protein
MTVITLDGTNSRSVRLAPGYTLEAPGLVGRVNVVAASDQTTRSAEGLSETTLAAALEHSGLIVRQFFELDVAADRGAGSAAPRTRSTGEAAITLRAPAIGPEVGQAVLYSDETGLLQWIFPDQPSAAESTRGGAEVIYRIPRRQVAVDSASPETRQRGTIIKLGRKIVRVVLWATDAIVGQGVQAVMRAWETEKRPYGWQMLPLSSTDPVNWDRLRGGRGLLFLHGTFSSAADAFHALPAETVERLRQHYDGRLLAFNHPSVHQSPPENIARLLDELPAGLELDIVTHSRGGLVGRELIRQAAEQPGRQLRIGKAVLVAAPNRGTPLANGDHWIDMLDRYTNLIAQAPDTSFTLLLEGVLTFVKIVGHAGLDALPGLKAMLPDGEYLRGLNANPPSTTRYHALVADYQPNDAGWINRFYKRVQDKLVDGLFAEPNDGVVPTSGGYSASRDGSGWQIPAAQRREFVTSDGVSHSTFFANPTVNEYLLRWLVAEQAVGQ